MERKVRGYKIEDKPYFKAKKRAKGKLATLVEIWVSQYANGYNVGITYDNPKTNTKTK